jgi:hypothetical protein
MISLRSLMMFAILCEPVSAQDWTSGTVAGTLEGPAHEALVTLMAQPETTLAPFETDGCSGGLSDVWQVVASRFPSFAEAHQSLPPWEGCCVTHDRAYHNAGKATEAGTSFEARLSADLALETCVVETATDRVDAMADVYDVNPDQIERAYGSIAKAMFLAVRFGGAPCSGLSWRWGYGYPACSVLTSVFD